MVEPFDPYRQWLGIARKDQPPHHYRLLGIALWEASPEVVRRAADERVAQLRAQASGEHATVAQKLLHEVATARDCLLDPRARGAYDAALKAKLPAISATSCPAAGSAATPAAADATAAFVHKSQRTKTLGEYTILKKIGAGGMGQVFKAEHRRMKRIVALKILPRESVKSAELVQRFYREVEAAAKLSHPNIVTAHDAGEQNGIHYLVMEFVDGPDLATLVRQRGPLPVEDAVSCLIQAARGLEYAHGLGIIHRDIKPANLLVDKKGTVKVLDMGLARVDQHLGTAPAAEGLTHTGQIMGTAEYMSPEQAEDTHSADARSDIYSLGCALFRLLTDRLPFHGETTVKTLWAHRQAPIPSLQEQRPDVPAELDGVFRRMVAKRPEDRFQTMGEVIAALRAFVASGASVTSIDEPSSNSNLSFLEELAATSGTRLGRSPSTAGGEATINRQVEQETDRAVKQPSRAKTGKRRLPLIAGATVLVLCIVTGVWFAVHGGPDLDSGKPGANIAKGKSDGSTSKFESVDLLKRIELPRDAVYGRWEFKEKTLIFPAVVNARLQIPYDLPAKYELRMVVERTAGTDALAICVCIGGFPAIVLIDAGPDTWTGLQTGDGEEWGIKTANVANVLAGKPKKIVCNVEKRSVKVTCNDQTIIDWTGDPALLSVPEGWEIKHPNQLMLGAWQTKYEISKLELKPLSAEPQPQPYRDAIEWIYAVGGAVSNSGREQPRKSYPTAADVLQSLPTEIDVDLGGRQVRDADLVKLRALPSITALTLSHAGITDVGMQHLKALRHLVQLKVDGNAITDAGVEQIEMCQSLTRLNLSATQVTGQGLAHLKNLPALQKLELIACDLVGEGLDQLRGCDQLNNLQLSTVTDAGLGNVEHLPALRSIDIYAPIKASDEAINRFLAAAPDREISALGDPVDLLKRIDAQRDAVAGHWEFDGQALVSSADEYARLVIQYELPPQFRLRLSLTRTTGEGCFAVGLPAGQSQCLLAFDDFGPRHLSGVSEIDHKSLPDAGQFWEGPVFTNGTPVQCDCLVQVVGEKTYLYAQAARFWLSRAWDSSRLSVPKPWKVPDINRLFIGSSKSSFRITELTLTPQRTYRHKD